MLQQHIFYLQPLSGTAPEHRTRKAYGLNPTLLLPYLSVTNVGLQTVQQQLSEKEKADKQDDSPVTVADYGEAASRDAATRAYAACMQRSCSHVATV